MKAFYSHIFRILIFNIFYVPLALFPSSDVAAQEENKLILLNGTVLSSDSLKPVFNAHIISKYNYWGTISDEKGNFKMHVSPNDSILITSVGFSPLILSISESMLTSDKPFPIILQRDTVQINEVVIHAFWDYPTFKQMIINMEPMTLDNVYNYINGINRELEYNPVYSGFKGPIQALYDQFNQSARLQRKLIKNRSDYNNLMIQQGRYRDTIPAMPEHMQELPH